MLALKQREENMKKHKLIVLLKMMDYLELSQTNTINIFRGIFINKKRMISIEKLINKKTKSIHINPLFVKRKDISSKYLGKKCRFKQYMARSQNNLHFVFKDIECAMTIKEARKIQVRI